MRKGEQELLLSRLLSAEVERLLDIVGREEDDDIVFTAVDAGMSRAVDLSRNKVISSHGGFESREGAYGNEEESTYRCIDGEFLSYADLLRRIDVFHFRLQLNRRLTRYLCLRPIDEDRINRLQVRFIQILNTYWRRYMRKHVAAHPDHTSVTLMLGR